MDPIIITVEAVSTPVVVNVLEQGPEGPPGVGTVTSIFGRTGVVTAQNGDYTASQVGADEAGTASSAIATHVALSDPHTQYALKSGLGDAATKNVGTVAGTVAAGDHSHSNATTEAAGFLSAADKSKLDGIAAGANNYTLPTASDSTLGGIKIGGGLSIDGNGVLNVSDPSIIELTDSTDLLAAHNGKILLLNKATAAVLTIRKNSVTAYPVGFSCTWIAKGAGQWTFTASAGDGTVVLNVRGGATKTAGQWAAGALIQPATDVWVNSGDLTP